MTKTLILATTLLTLGVGTAFAGDGDVYAQPAQVSRAAASGQASTTDRLFPADTRPATSVYPLFAHQGYPQGGNQ
jgi:hypothetical protein